MIKESMKCGEVWACIVLVSHHAHNAHDAHDAYQPTTLTKLTIATKSAQFHSDAENDSKSKDFSGFDVI